MAERAPLPNDKWWMSFCTHQLDCFKILHDLSHKIKPASCASVAAVGENHFTTATYLLAFFVSVSLHSERALRERKIVKSTFLIFIDSYFCVHGLPNRLTVKNVQQQSGREWKNFERILSNARGQSGVEITGVTLNWMSYLEMMVGT